MNTEEFRKYGKQMIDYICEYGQTIDERDVAPTVDPGFLRKLLPGTLVSYPPLRSLRKTILLPPVHPLVQIITRPLSSC